MFILQREILNDNMILRFTTANHLSFRDKVDLIFHAGGIKELSDANVYELKSGGHEFKLLKSLGIFGENASGKSNLIKSFAFMKSFILNSGNQSLNKNIIPVHPFRLNTTSDTNASHFEIIIYSDGKFYRYGFDVSPTSVEKEWLFQAEKKKEELLFLRVKDEYKIEKRFREEAQGDVLTKITKSNTLFLSVLAQFNSSVAKSIVSWFNNTEVIFDFDTVTISKKLRELLHHDLFKHQLNIILASFPFGFTTIEEELKSVATEKTSEGFLKNIMYDEDVKNFAIKTKHKKFDENNKHIGYEYFDLATNESAGTVRFLGLLNPILTSLHEKKLIWIDEIDAHLHPNIVVMLIKLFNSVSNNPNGAQLVFTSQNTKPLQKGFRRDQMILMEKDAFGVSHSASLYLRKPDVRNDASFEKDYLDSKYVRVPNLNRQLNLFDSV